MKIKVFLLMACSSILAIGAHASPVGKSGAPPMEQTIKATVSQDAFAFEPISFQVMAPIEMEMPAASEAEALDHVKTEVPRIKDVPLAKAENVKYHRYKFRQRE